MKSKQYWVDRLGEGWTNALKDTLKSPYMEKLMNFVDCQYAMEDNVFPNNSKIIFDAFKACPWDTVKVVIIGYEPNPIYGTGPLAYSDEFQHPHKNSSLYAITTSIMDEYYRGYDINFDYTLKSWASQGVLLLNQALTATREDFAHRVQWKRFFNAVIAAINAYKPGTIVFLWGEESMWLMPELDMQHVFNWEHPYKYAHRTTSWKCPNFTQANKLIEYINGEGSQIKW